MRNVFTVIASLALKLAQIPNSDYYSICTYMYTLYYTVFENTYLTYSAVLYIHCISLYRVVNSRVNGIYFYNQTLGKE